MSAVAVTVAVVVGAGVLLLGGSLRDDKSVPTVGSTSGEGSAAQADAAVPDPVEDGPHVIQWVDDISFAKYKVRDFGGTDEQLASPACNTQAWGLEFITFFDESGTAVAEPAKAIAEAAPVENTDLLFTCRFRASVTVDDAQRYRAERSVGNFEARADYPATAEYSYVDKATLEGRGWVWEAQGGFAPS